MGEVEQSKPKTTDEAERFRLAMRTIMTLPPETAAAIRARRLNPPQDTTKRAKPTKSDDDA
jgi:hypothetical protein